jgi:heme exporter protein D
MTQGVISGGWQFVWMAYGITATAFIVYGVSLFVRLRGATSHDPRNASRIVH